MSTQQIIWASVLAAVITLAYIFVLFYERRLPNGKKYIRMVRESIKGSMVLYGCFLGFALLHILRPTYPQTWIIMVVALVALAAAWFVLIFCIRWWYEMESDHFVYHALFRRPKAYRSEDVRAVYERFPSTFLVIYPKGKCRITYHTEGHGGYRLIDKVGEMNACMVWGKPFCPISKKKIKEAEAKEYYAKLQEPEPDELSIDFGDLDKLSDEQIDALFEKEDALLQRYLDEEYDREEKTQQQHYEEMLIRRLRESEERKRSALRKQQEREKSVNASAKTDASAQKSTVKTKMKQCIRNFLGIRMYCFAKRR